MSDNCSITAGQFLGLVEEVAAAKDPYELFPEEAKEFGEMLVPFGAKPEQIGFVCDESYRKPLSRELKKYISTNWLSLPIAVKCHDKGTKASPLPMKTAFAYSNKEKPVQLEIIYVPEGQSAIVHKKWATECGPNSTHFAFGVDDRDSFQKAVIQAMMHGAELLQTGEINELFFSASYAYFDYKGVVVEIVHSSPSMSPFSLEIARLLM